jgi:type IV secretory pathway component VirB8
MWAIQPRKYSHYMHNVSGLQEEWDRLVTHKRRWVKWAGILFAVGTVALAVLIVLIVWPV